MGMARGFCNSVGMLLFGALCKTTPSGTLSAIGASVEIAKRSELHQFAVIPKRWVVERAFGWLEKCRRLWKNCERKLNTSLNMVVLAFLALLLKRS